MSALDSNVGHLSEGIYMASLVDTVAHPYNLELS